MSDQTTAKGNTGTRIAVGALVFVLAGFMGFVLLVVMIGGMFASNSESSSAETPACTASATSSAGVQIPAEYQDYIDTAATEAGFSSGVIAAQLQQESGFDPTAVSPANAKGMAQFRDAAWQEFGNGGDPFDPEDAIAAQGRYMKYLRDFMKDHARDEEHLLELVLAGYNAGQGAVASYNYDLDEMFKVGGYKTETKPYVENIKAAAEGNYTSDCEHSGGAAPDGDIVESAMYLAWDERVVLPQSYAHDYGRDAAKPEFVETSTSINNDTHTAYFTDCGVYVATVMISSGTDPDFPTRGTGIQLSYLQNSSKYEVFTPSNEGELEPGDILIRPGHIYLYTGERHEGIDGRAQGASLSTRPPSGHHVYLSDSGGAYSVARYVGG